jgi:hypothetical protein
MSDGPHRSLPMSQGWRRFAERIYIEAFSHDEERNALVTVLLPHSKTEGQKAQCMSTRLQERFISIIWQVSCIPVQTRPRSFDRSFC